MLALLACLLLGLAACGEGDDAAEESVAGLLEEELEALESDMATAEADGADTGAGVPADPDLPGDDLRIVDLGPPIGGEVDVEVADDDVSLLFVAQGIDPADTVDLLEVIAPDGSSVDAPLALQPFNGGEVAALLPLSAEEPLTAGTWTFVVEAEQAVTGAFAVLQRGPLPAQQVIDVTFHIASTVAAEATAEEREALALVYRNAGDTIFNPHGLGVGDIEIVDTDPAVTEAFALLDLPSSGDDLAQREICAALDAGEGPSRRLAFAIVDEVVDPDDDEGETEGNAAGLPGATILPGMSTSCVVMVADGSRDITDLASTVWHEVGHLLGLAHTTESDGLGFDPIPDTPECDLTYDDDDDGYVDASECPDGDNLMFHDSDALALTPQQAFVLRHHPLFHAP